MSLKLEVVQHETGERIPLILDSEGFPLSAPNEWLLSRRELSQNTLIRNARELIIFVQWLSDGKIGLEERIRSERFFTEAEIKGGLIERLRHSQGASKHQLGVLPRFCRQMSRHAELLHRQSLLHLLFFDAVPG